MKSKQLSLFKPLPIAHGGELSRGKRKTLRPFDPQKAIHATFRATRAKREWSMLARRHKGDIYLHALKVAEDSGVKLYRCVNVGNHLHLVLKARRREQLQRFLRVFAGKIAMLVTGGRKGNPKGRFWDFLVHTKIVSWGRQFAHLARYMEKNLAEAEGANALLIFAGAELRARPG